MQNFRRLQLNPTTLYPQNVSTSTIRSYLLPYWVTANRARSINHIHTSTSSASVADRWSGSLYDRNTSWVYSAGWTDSALRLLDARSGERIADFGCGSGVLTKQLESMVGKGGYVFGLDGSESMVKTSRELGIRAEHHDLQEPLTKDYGMSSFDAVFSNAVLHWCKRNPSGPIENAWKLLKPGGRFVGEFGTKGTMGGVNLSIHHILRSRGYDVERMDAYYFPSVPTYKRLLEEQGFIVEYISINPRLQAFDNKTGLRGFLDAIVRNTILAELNDAEANSVMEEAERMAAIDFRNHEGVWALPYHALLFKAVKRAA